MSPPATTSDARVISVHFSDWEVACCIDVPEVGDIVSWRLLFGTDASFTSPERPGVLTRHWRVERRPDGSTWLVDDPVVAWWPEWVRPSPAPGEIELTGTLGTVVHVSEAPADLPSVTARVRRVRVVKQLYEQNDAGDLDFLPGTIEVHDVDQERAWQSREVERADRYRDDDVRLVVDLGLPAAYLPPQTVPISS